MIDMQRRSVIAAVEMVLVFGLFTFLFQFAWEVLQLPFYKEMAAMNHWEGTLVCLRATGGDLMIALAAFAAGVWWSKRLDWMLDPAREVVVIYVMAGLLITIAFEWYAVFWANRWAYSELMPVIPVLRVGLTPILQWLVLPPITLYFVHWHYVGRLGKHTPATSKDRK